MSKSPPTLASLADAQANLAKQIAEAELPLVESAIRVLSDEQTEFLKAQVGDLIAQFGPARLLGDQLGHVLLVLNNVKQIATNEQTRIRGALGLNVEPATGHEDDPDFDPFA